MITRELWSSKIVLNKIISQVTDTEFIFIIMTTTTPLHGFFQNLFSFHMLPQ
jgi:hypothetical protein